MSDCLFCKIIDGEIPAKVIYEDEWMTVFHDISPQAPTHFLVIPKKHISSVNELTSEDEALVGKIVVRIAGLTKELGLKDGYRIVINTGKDGQQTVQHLHFHVLGGRSLQWPPG